MQRALLEIESAAGPKTYELNLRGGNSFDELYVDFQLAGEQGGERYTVFLHPKQDIVVKRLEIRFAVSVSPDARFFANGYQSRSESRLWPANAALPRLRAIAKPLMGRYGDDWIDGIPNKGLHSWTYTYLTGPREKIRFWGSLNESTGFTLFLYDSATGLLTVRKDMGNLRLSHSFPALDCWTGEGDEAAVFDAWVKQTVSSFKKNQTEPIKNTLNWTSRGLDPEQINEEIILQNLESVANSGLPFRYFQIDDGWQTAAGDWRSVKPVFPGGMGLLAGKIREKGLIPGLWLAPFVASGRSQLVKRNPEWLLKGLNEKPLRAGWNRAWGGWFYALNFYHPGVQDYLSGVFHIVLEQWGYAMVKPDFLFAACLAPPPGKTRGQVMRDAMEFLRRQLGERTMLASGVPLGSAFGLADICRTGSDVRRKWEHRLPAFLRQRERAGALASLRSALGRWQLNRRFFCTGPDVFILRRENQYLSPIQQNTLLTINALLGGILFTADDVGAYTPEQRAELGEALDWHGSRIEQVKELEKDVYRIDFEQNGQRYSAFCNLSPHQVRLSTSNTTTPDLLPYETMVLNAGFSHSGLKL